MHVEAEHNLTPLALGNSIFSAQKCYISKLLRERFPTEFKAMHYVSIPVSQSQSCICKLYWKTDLQESYCEVDTSVVCSSKHDETNIVNNISSVDGLVLQKFRLCDMKLLPPVAYVSSINVTPVMNSSEAYSRWKNLNIRAKLCSILNEILQLFVITNNSIVYVKNLQHLQEFGIHCILINNFQISANQDLNLSVGKVTSSSTVYVSNIMSKKRFDHLYNTTPVEVLGGLDEPYSILKGIVVASKTNKLNRSIQKLGVGPLQQVLLIGPPGSGKTSLVRKVSVDCGATLITLLGPEICCPEPGETEANLRKIFDEAVERAEEECCVLLLDEVDSLCPERLDSSSSHLTRVMSQLLSMLENVSTVAGLVIVATTNRPHALDPALRRHGRLETEVHIGIPNEHERVAILDVLLTRFVIADHGELCKQVARLTPGYVGADLVLVCQDVMLRRFRRTKEESTDESMNLQSWITDFRVAVSNIRPSLLRGGLGVVKSSPVSLSSIGGLTSVKQTLRASVEWPLSHPDAFARLGLPQPKGILLYGPPGCAKTTIVQAVAMENNINFLSVSAAELYSPFVGDAERSVGELFHRARLSAPSIVFIDEIDALVGSRSERERSVQERVLSALLTEMDGIGVHVDDSVNSTQKVLEGEAVEPNSQVRGEGVTNRGVVVVGATNRPDMLDSALLRPGRFDKLVHVPAPDVKDRLDILQQITSKMSIDVDVNLSSIAEKTNLFSGADLVNLMKEAGLCALTEDGMDVKCIKQIHFLHALDKMKPSLTKEQVCWYSAYGW